MLASQRNRSVSWPVSALLVLVFYASGCRDTHTVEQHRAGAVHRVELTPLAASLGETDTLRFRAVPRDSAGLIVPRTRAVWSSSHTEIAVIDSLGLVRALAAGQTTIRALVGGVTGSAALIVQPSSLTAFARVDAGAEHTCGISESGRVLCWGGNTFGQLGPGAQTTSVSPVAVGGLDAVSITSANRHTCVAGRMSGVWCWGSNSAGQLGDTMTGKKVNPAPVSTIEAEEFVEVTAGSGHSCALTRDGRAFCWGSNPLGQLGRGFAGGMLGAGLVTGIVRFRTLSAGQGHTCGVSDSGEVWCWGWNEFGQLGLESSEACGDSPCQRQPARVSSTVRFRSVSVGHGFSCALGEDGAAYCWGLNADGQLGDGTRTASSRPVRVQAPQVAALDAGWRHACALTAAGSTYCWGANVNGELASPLPGSSPVPVRASVPSLRWISAGVGHSCGVTATGAAYCWGDPGDGRLGIKGELRGRGPD